MPERTTCRGCSRPIPKGGDRYCAACKLSAPPTRPASAPWSEFRRAPGGRQEQTRFRARLMAEYGGRCAAVGGLSTFTDLEQGARCPVTNPSELDACHGIDGGPDVLLCNPHHVETDRSARMRK